MKKTHEQRLAEAIERLTVHREFLTYRGHGGYGGAIAQDLKLVLRELEDLRAALVEQRCAIMNYPDRMTLQP